MTRYHLTVFSEKLQLMDIKDVYHCT